MKKKLLPLAIVGALSLVGCSKTKEPKTEEEKAMYSVGVMFGSRLNQLQLTDEELDSLSQGLRDSAKNEKQKVDPMQYQQKIQDIFKDRMAKQAGDVKKKGQEFLDKFVAEGATKTASGLAYKHVKEGTGPSPKETDTVKVHYHGTLMDGTVFDSRGWTEGVQLMKVGGTTKFVIPSDLAYGDTGAPPKIKGGDTLVFEVELISISQGQEAPAAQAPAKKK
ncbi:MAG: FKBP-type peptidyl-prolyl cis-trans isomerase [Bacteriovoracaceae bacterium]|nr:FKBP-type peptidyl-prolyl cis-trans isomerase [Bacteriovoracaceae bacterium]